MRNRQKQRALRRSGKREESISRRNNSWAVDLTPYEAVEKIKKAARKSPST